MMRRLFTFFGEKEAGSKQSFEKRSDHEWSKPWETDNYYNEFVANNTGSVQKKELEADYYENFIANNNTAPSPTRK